MAGEMLADDNSPMMMTVSQYNDRVAYTWKLATEAEQERIINLLKDWSFPVNQGTYTVDSSVNELIELIKGDNK